MPQTYAERSSYIIKEFFVHHRTQLDLCELCDILYLSYSSIKSLLQKMNKEYDQTRFVSNAAMISFMLPAVNGISAGS